MKKFRIGIIGALIGFTLSLGVGAHAEVINMIGKVIDGSFPIKINGTTLQNPALTIEGVSYVPTREFAESLGAEVKFNADMGIEVVPTTTPVQTPKPKPAPTKEQLQNMIDSKKEEIDGLKRGLSTTGGGTLREDVKAKIESKLEEKGKELSDLQAQLDALQQ